MKITKEQYQSVFKIAIPFALGALITYFIMPEKIKIKKEIDIQEVEVIKKEIEYKDRVVVEYRDKVVVERVRKVKRKETFPDGHIIEEEIFESESEQVDRIRKEENERYSKLLDLQKTEFNKKISSLKIHTNPKRFILHGGISSDLDNLTQKPAFMTGISVGFWGPLVLTGQVATDKKVNFLLGIRF